jgi:hypothetical protein
MQNFAPWGFSAEQFWQRIDLPVDQATSPSCITRRREEAAGFESPRSGNESKKLVLTRVERPTAKKSENRQFSRSRPFRQISLYAAMPRCRGRLARRAAPLTARPRAR